MKKQICTQCSKPMKLIDKYSQFLEPDEMRKLVNLQKINETTSKINNTLFQSKVSVEIYKCDICGIYHGTEYV